MNEYKLSMTAEPIIPAWTTENYAHVSGSELQRAILRGFADPNNPANPFEKVFTFKEHGEFFRGALTMAGLRYTGDFFELLQRYGTIKVTIRKSPKQER